VKPLIVTVACVLCACGQASTAEEPNSSLGFAVQNDVYPAPVTDASAPTVADLRRRGLHQIDDEPMGWSCGDNCYADGFTAIYMGRESARNVAAHRQQALMGGAPVQDRQFICPVARGDMDAWKCQPVEMPGG
jgi:hypothetical protein